MNCKCQSKSSIPVFFLLGAHTREVFTMSHFPPVFAPSCPLPRLWALLSLHERNNMKWRNTSMSPFPPLLHKWLYNWFFSFPPVVPAIGAVITIYLGSLFHYSRAAAKPRKSAVFYDLWRLFDLCLLEGSTERAADFGNRLWALHCDGSMNMALTEDGMGILTDWKTKMTWSKLQCLKSLETSTCYCCTSI